MAFESTLLECSERAGWALHAFCIMGNHYHAAIQTPRGNLSEAAEPEQKDMAFAQMSEGCAVGTEQFRKSLFQETEERRAGMRFTQQEAKEMRQLACEEQLQKCLKVFAKTTKHIKEDTKSAVWKVAIAALLKQRFMCTNSWLSERINMGRPFGVSRYLAKMVNGKRTEAYDCFTRISAKIKY